jgi:hypothetical protein
LTTVVVLPVPGLCPGYGLQLRIAELPGQEYVPRPPLPVATLIRSSFHDNPPSVQPLRDALSLAIAWLTRDSAVVTL